MTSVLAKIIDAFKAMLDKMEQEGQQIVSELKAYSADVARQIETETRAIFRDIRKRFSRMIQLFKSKIESLKNRAPNTTLGPHATAFSARLRNSMKFAEKEIERFARDFKNDTVAILEDAKNVIKRIADGLRTSIEDIGSVTKKAGEDIVRALADIGEDAIKKTETFVGDVSKSFEMDASFVHKHGVQVGEAALVAFDPVLVVGLGLSAGILIGVHAMYP